MSRARSRPDAPRRRWGLVAAVALALLVGSLAPASPGGPEPPAWVDEAVHALGYAALGVSLAYATRDVPGRPRRAVGVVLAATAYGAALEVAQVPIPGRQFAVGDVLANAAGAALGVVWLALVPRLRGRRGRESD